MKRVVRSSEVCLKLSSVRYFAQSYEAHVEQNHVGQIME
jgi:hypothetical protein